MKIIHENLIQGTEEWFAVRRGILTASEIKNIITPKTLKLSAASEDHLYELAAQRIQKYVEPRFVGRDMLRGIEDEPVMRTLYNDHIAPVLEVGFITENKWGFKIGYSPDGLVGENGAIECKSRSPKLFINTVIDGKSATEHMLQLQTGMMVAGLDWIDVCYGCFTPEEAPEEAETLPMAVYRAYPVPEVQEAIINAAGEFYEKLDNLIELYDEKRSSEVVKFVPTKRKPNLNKWEI